MLNYPWCKDGIHWWKDVGSAVWPSCAPILCTPPTCALLNCLCVCEWGSLEACFSLALGEKKRGHPYSLVPSRRLRVWSVPSVAHKFKEGLGWGLSLQPKVKHGTDYQTITKVNTFIPGLLATLDPVNLWVDDLWNFLSKWASQSSYVITYASDI